LLCCKTLALHEGCDRLIDGRRWRRGRLACTARAPMRRVDQRARGAGPRLDVLGRRLGRRLVRARRALRRGLGRARRGLRRGRGRARGGLRRGLGGSGLPRHIPTSCPLSVQVEDDIDREGRSALYRASTRLRNLGGPGFKSQCRGTTSRYYETKNHDRACKCFHFVILKGDRVVVGAVEASLLARATRADTPRTPEGTFNALAMLAVPPVHTDGE
jgi:hypothetical protein